jgi:AraC-like DNA-binding protein
VSTTPAPSTPTCASWNIAYLFAYAQGRGLSRAQLAEHFEVDLDALDDVDGRLPLRTLVRMWTELPELVSDPDMPLHVIEHVSTKEMPVLALLFLASPTLADGFKQLERYQRITHDLSLEPASRWVREGVVAHLELYHERSVIPPPTAAVIDAQLAILLMARMATGQEITPLAVSLRHPLPRDPKKYDAAFRCRVQFDAERDRLTLAASDLALPHLDPSRTLQRMAAQYADAMLAKLPSEVSPLGEIRTALRERLAHGEISLQELGRALGMSPRTLQRRLEQAGTNLRELIEEERRMLALAYIKHKTLSLSDIALLLGFSELSAFSRAFSRWTNVTPSEYRRAHR